MKRENLLWMWANDPQPKLDFSAPKETPGCAPSYAHARRSDPETSHEAAASVRNITELQQAIYSALEDRPCIDGVLIERIRNAGFKVSESGVRSRRSELVGFGIVRDSGQRETLESGRKAIVWEAIKKP